MEESMNRTGRPRNNGGSPYQRRDSAIWWMSYRDREGRFRQESTGRKDRQEAEKVLRKQLVARDEGLLPDAAPSAAVTFDEWADWFLEHRSKPPFRSGKTHQQNLGALKFLRPRFGKTKLHDITSEDIEAYLMKRLNSGKRVYTKFGLELRGRLRPATAHQEFRILRRILNVAVIKRRLAANPCGGVEFPVALAGTTRKPHYLTASEQERLEACAPAYLRHIIVIMTETGLRPYRELIPMRKEQIDLDNGIVHLPDSKTVHGIADMPLTERAREAFRAQLKLSGDSEYLFPSPRAGAKQPHITTVRKLWDRTLERAGLPHFALYELRHTFATRLSAGGVADHFVTQMLRQGDAAVFKRYSQAKLNMMREALAKLDRQANERGGTSLTALAG
jgi:integrase